MPKMLLTLDMFAEPIPQFNLKGKDAMRTYFGGLLSLLAYYLTFMFALNKFRHLITRHNPQIV